MNLSYSCRIAHLARFHRSQRCRERPAAITVLLRHDEMFTFNGVPIGAKRCQFQRVIQHFGHLRQLETGKPSVMGIAKAWRQDQTQGLTNQSGFRPAVDGLKRSLIS